MVTSTPSNSSNLELGETTCIMTLLDLPHWGLNFQCLPHAYRSHCVIIHFEGYAFPWIIRSWLWGTRSHLLPIQISLLSSHLILWGRRFCTEIVEDSLFHQPLITSCGNKKKHNLNITRRHSTRLTSTVSVHLLNWQMNTWEFIFDCHFFSLMYFLISLDLGSSELNSKCET